MKVYYSKGWAITFMIAGAILISLNFWLFQLTGEMVWYRIGPGFAVIIVGILYFNRPYFELRKKAIVTYSLLGFVSWRYSFNEITELVFENDKLYRNKKGKLRRLRISKFVCDKKQWEEFVLLVNKSEPGSNLHE